MTREEAEQYLYYAMTIGEQLLCCGAEVGRVEDTIRRICLAYGATRADVFSITSSIVTTIYGEDFGICTQTRRVPGMSNDLGRLDDLNQLSRYICEYRPKPEEIQKGLEKIRDKQGYSFKTQILIYAVISGSFSVFFGGDVNDMIASALIGIALKLFEAFCKKRCIKLAADSASLLRSRRSTFQSYSSDRAWTSCGPDQYRKYHASDTGNCIYQFIARYVFRRYHYRFDPMYGGAFAGTGRGPWFHGGESVVLTESGKFS